LSYFANLTTLRRKTPPRERDALRRRVRFSVSAPFSPPSLNGERFGQPIFIDD
jgi:hypothetical protein